MEILDSYSLEPGHKGISYGHNFDSLDLREVKEDGRHYLELASGDKSFMYLDPAEATILADNLKSDEKRSFKPSRGGKLYTSADHEIYGKRQGISGFMSGDHFSGYATKENEEGKELFELLEDFGHRYGKEDYETYLEKLNKHSTDVYDNLSPGFWASMELVKGFKACHPVYTPIYLAQLGANLTARHYNAHGNPEEPEAKGFNKYLRKGANKTREWLGKRDKDGTLNATHTGISTSLAFVSPFPLNLIFAADAIYNGVKAEKKGSFIKNSSSYVKGLFTGDDEIDHIEMDGTPS
ncbi:MAG: hypothetical protein QF415_13035 [Candidatus Undinarchaeales archaeon]|jgi:hypothetical protein|nr:hypothetical protein [Candidatus Undinarchaeales archaeon]MDP7493978.1 hypothetical protein [Candidatus Undinarchaeales archaeon]